MSDLQEATVQAVKSAMKWWDEDVHGDLEGYIATCAVDAVRANPNIKAATVAFHDAIRTVDARSHEGLHAHNIVAAALTPGATPITNCGDVKQIRHTPRDTK